MKKDDIIKQKLFETSNLSNFYLEYIIKCKWEDESPIQLANCYKQKLYEIADKYDRMLEASRKREQMSLSFEKPSFYNKNLLTPHSNPTGRTSTPYKQVTSKSNCSSYASSPSTPLHTRGFVRSSSASSNINKIYKSPYSRLLNNSTKKLSDLELRINSIYYGDYDEETEFDDDYNCDPKTGDLYNECTDEYETDYQEEIDTTVNNTNLNQNIEKSYSNLSKDSGVLVDSYHSDYSNCIFNEDKLKSYQDGTHLEHDINQEFPSPSSNEEEEIDKSHEEEERDQVTPFLGQNMSLKKIFNSKMENRRLNGTNQSNGYSVFNNKFYQNQYRTYTKNLLNKKLSNLKQKNPNLDLNIELDSTNLVSLIVDDQNNVIPNDINNSNSSLCSNSSTPSPSSSSSSETNEYEYNFKNNPNIMTSSSINNLNQSMNNSLIKSTNPLFFNYNSLMNVSMLDSIQLANNNLDIDMSSSILMFN